MFSDRRHSSIYTRGLSRFDTEFIKTDSCVILQYHRVDLLCNDPLQISVEPYKFESQMQYLAENYHPISMGEVEEHLNTKTAFEENSIAVTFDCAYSDLLYNAADVLAEYEIPATVFVPSAPVLSGERYWWDKLENIMFSDYAEQVLDVEINGVVYVLPLISTGDRFRAYDGLYRVTSGQRPNVRRVFLEQLSRRLGACRGEIDSSRLLRADELRSLEGRGAITIGGHTHTCSDLSVLTREEQFREISENKSVLENILGHEIHFFSFPKAQCEMESRDTTAVVQDAGFSLACGSCYGSLRASGESERFSLPRVRVGNRNLFSFHKFLERLQLS